MKQTTVLVAEDDVNIRQGLADTLESENYTVIQARDGQQALDLFSQQGADLILLDVMMPQKSGYDVCRAIRVKNKAVPIIMLTAKGEEIDKVVGLELGADDYITKPFGIHELLARINAVLRRSGPRAPGPDNGGTPDHGLDKQSFRFGSYLVNPRTYSLEGQETTHDLSKRELDLIRLFSRHPGEVLERDYILNQIWGIDYPGTTRTLDQHIALLRKKIEPSPKTPILITTVHGIGYRFEGS